MTTDNNDMNSAGFGLYGKVIALLRCFYIDIKKNIIVFAASIIVMISLFLAYNAKISNSYSTSFTVVYEDLVRKIYGDRLEKLNNLLQTNRDKAQALLGIEKNEFASLNEISATNILGDDLSADMNIDKIPFIITIGLNDTSYIKEIQDGIVNYLENGNEYLIEKRKLRRAEIEGELNFISEQLDMMDSLKKMYNSASTKSSSDKSTSDASSSPSSGSVYQLSYELYKKKQELLKKKELPLNLYVIDDAIVPVKDSKPYLLVVMAGAFVGFLVYLGITYFILPVIRYKEPA